MPSGPFSGIAAACMLAASLLATSLISTCLLFASGLAAQAGRPSGKSSCMAVADAAQAANANQDLCVQAHVYDVVELADGTRFLDVCPPDLKDDQCRFTLLSLAADREEIGDLRKYRDQDVVIRGIVRSTHGRMDAWALS